MLKQSLVDIGYTKLFIIIDREEKKIGVVLYPNKPAPRYSDVLYVISKNKHFRRMQRAYNVEDREHPFKTFIRHGMSGCIDCYFKVAKQLKNNEGCLNIYHIETEAKIHISSNENINQGIDMMYVGDFIEMVNSIGIKPTKVKYSYIRPIRYDDVEDYYNPTWHYSNLPPRTIF